MRTIQPTSVWGLPSSISQVAFKWRLGLVRTVKTMWCAQKRKEKKKKAFRKVNTDFDCFDYLKSCFEFTAANPVAVGHLCPRMPLTLVVLPWLRELPDAHTTGTCLPSTAEIPGRARGRWAPRGQCPAPQSFQCPDTVPSLNSALIKWKATPLTYPIRTVIHTKWFKESQDNREE